MTAKQTEISLGHKIYDLLARGEEGQLMSIAIHQRIAEVLAGERKACAEIALAIDSGRGNEKEIARGILGRGDMQLEQMVDNDLLSDFPRG